MNVAQYLTENYNKCLKISKQVTKDTYKAEEILHKTYIYLARWKTDAVNPEAYIHTMLRYQYLSFIKRNKKYENIGALEYTSSSFTYFSPEKIMMVKDDVNLWKTKYIIIQLLANKYNESQKEFYSTEKKNTTEDIIALRQAGKSLKEIANITGISVKGVKYHVTKINRRGYGR